MRHGHYSNGKRIGDSLAEFRDLSELTNNAYNNDPTSAHALCTKKAMAIFHIDDKQALEMPHVREEVNEDLAKYPVPVNGAMNMAGSYTSLTYTTSPVSLAPVSRTPGSLTPAQT